jgi:hypothetical protein
MPGDERRARSREFERSAKALLVNARYEVAYHTAGIAVQCALKAKVATMLRANDVPEGNLSTIFIVTVTIF